MSIDNNNIIHPDYMDMQFFENILKSGLKNESFKIEKVKFTSGHIPGENYCSEIYRAVISPSNSNGSLSKQISLIIKTECLSDQYKTADFFGKEMDTYTIALPEIHSILENVKIAPNFFYASRNPVDVIVLQDMSCEGYKVADRVKGLDEKDCQIVLGKLAKYHAASMKLRESNFKQSKHFDEGMINDDSKIFIDALLKDALQELAGLVEQWPGFEMFSEKLLNLRSNIFEILKTANSPEDCDSKVLVHNDLWTNNILFKYIGDVPTDALLIDFQATFFCSLGIDITHFFYTTPQYDLLETHRDIMVKEYYYEPFSKTLEDIGYHPIPSLEDVCNEIDKREISGFLWSVAKLYLICMEKDDCSDNSIDNIADKEIGAKLRAKGMASERYQKTIKYILKRLEKLEMI